jgi:hypothetical protein
MIHKHPPRPERLRQIPPSFSWVDHRLVRHQHLRRAEPQSWALYLFLVTVADSRGLSYYSDASIARHLNLDPLGVGAARQRLIELDLIAYRKPLYQVLALPEDGTAAAPATETRSGQARRVGDILRQALEGGRP